VDKDKQNHDIDPRKSLFSIIGSTHSLLCLGFEKERL